ncbi:NADPH-dependent FMN reductase [Henriciella aquimarina]|uniref:NADPH-dependent FMN reductase n=1 Tax=Henriciella aquimarina TaxID=545261 RepID=UPI000A02C48F|nr:NAD(P)H-dependent oxidoreductase [Henriciella aquimarina]
MPSKILVFAASLRTGSFNACLADLVAWRLEEDGASVTRLDLGAYDLPIYHGDIEANDGVPEPAMKLHEQFRNHDAIFIASPEYNANVSPLLANVLAWVSRIPENGGMAAAFGQPVFALGSASPGGFGGYRGLMALRNMLELQLGARVLTAMVSVPQAHEAFDEGGNLVAPFPKKMLEGMLASITEVTR